MFSDLSLHKMLSSQVLRDIERKKWNNFDFHRDSFMSTLAKLKLVKWAVVDSEKYDKVNEKPKEWGSMAMLRSSKYGHRTFTKCFPSPSKCWECYKYFCGCCGEGTNCMYGEKCLDRRCSSTLDKYPEIYQIDSEPKRVFMYGSRVYDIQGKKPSVCSRELYGY
jgi:hypothetical protein